jgi:glycosyltransferase involved in cell wall biosynthesis
MPSFGSLLYRARSTLGHGLNVAWQRDVIRPRILATPAVNRTDDMRCEIHVLTSGGDWLNLIWALKSFYHFSGRRYALCIHDDGTLERDHRVALRCHFPAARLIGKAEADAKMSPLLSDHPRCAELRRTNHLSPKIFDFASYAQSDRLLLLDSDVLFFAEPVELLRRIEDPEYRRNSVNADVASAYTVDPDDVRRLTGVELIARFNSGLGLIHRDSLNLAWLEEFLALPGIIGHFWRIEQTLFALCSSRWGAELLPEEYAVHLQGSVGRACCRHYVGAIRHLFYGEGVRRLTRDGMLRATNGERMLSVVHLPYYEENAYQPRLMSALGQLGVRTIIGGGGGNFLGSALFRWHADVLHFHWLHPYLLRRGRFASIMRSSRFFLEIVVLKIAGKKVVWTAHNLTNHEGQHPRIERWATRQFCRWANAVIVHCNSAARATTEHFSLREPPIVVPHGSYVGVYPDQFDREASRQALSLPAEATVFLFLGRIRPYKGVMELLGAFAAIDRPDARLVIAGQPDESLTESDRTRLATAPNVDFMPGYVPDDRIGEFMCAADVVVFPYRDVLTSGAVLLAMSFGKACIAPRLGCIPETFGGDGGILYDASEPAALTEALAEALRRSDELCAMGERNRRLAEQSDWNTTAALTLDVYRKVLGQTANGTPTGTSD